MESFYGGRQGVSFVIVKRFDGIDIPQDNNYSSDYFAYDETNEKFIIENNSFIRRTVNNYKNYLSWKRHYLNGETISGASFPLENAQGMVQCFEQGAITANIVNYGEYVIIDTPDKNNPDNGKVYRRGLNYQKSETNPLAGAEYIGQIVGPQGDSPELEIDDYDVNENTGEYVVNDGLVPGAKVEYQDGKVIVSDFEDAIKYSWVTLRDEFGNIYGCKIGFQFPYFVLALTAESVNPYYNRSNNNKDFINENLITRIDNESHPYFSQWHISVPKGIKGDAETDLHKISSVAKKGASYYLDINCTTELGILPNDVDVNLKTYDSSLHIDSLPIAIVNAAGEDNIYYVKKEDLYRDVLIYKQINYDRIPEGEYEYIILGDYNVIDRVTLADNGILTVYYTHDDAFNLEQALRWIHIVTDENGNIIDNGIQLAEDGTLTITYNTEHLNEDGAIVKDFQSYGQAIRWIKEENGIQGKGIQILKDGSVKVTYNTTHQEEGKTIQDFDLFEKALTWIEDISIQQTGEFKVLYNNDNTESGKDSYENILKWIDACEIQEDGTIIFYYNQRTEDGKVVEEAYKAEKYLKKITNIQVNWDKGETKIAEGEGDQRLHVTYNTDEEEVIGAPINYIMEALVTVSISDKNISTVEANHLLVLYSDPAYRARLKEEGKCVRYRSNKFINDQGVGQVRDDWYDMGYVRGEPGTIRFIGNLTDAEAATLLIDGNSPEKITGSDSYSGYCYTVGDENTEQKIIYYYDYTKGKWIILGSIASSVSNPNSVITVGIDGEDYPNLNSGGFLLVLETLRYAD